jgi:hypothetical protein
LEADRSNEVLEILGHSEGHVVCILLMDSRFLVGDLLREIILLYLIHSLGLEVSPLN